MMKYRFNLFLMVALAAAAGSIFAEEAATPATVAAPVAAEPVAAIPVLFRKPVALRGTLGDLKVQLNIRPKADIDEGLEGEYFVFGGSPKILLAGEMEGDALLLEESENGTDISGQWDGKLAGDTLSGSWTSADGLVTKPFKLQVIPSTPSKVAQAKKTADVKKP